MSASQSFNTFGSKEMLLSAIVRFCSARSTRSQVSINSLVVFKIRTLHNTNQRIRTKGHGGMGNSLCCGPRKPNPAIPTSSTSPFTPLGGSPFTPLGGIEKKKTTKPKPKRIIRRKNTANSSSDVDELLELNKKLTEMNIASEKEIVYTNMKLERISQELTEARQSHWKSLGGSAKSFRW
jgi:hypothetical protein